MRKYLIVMVATMCLGISLAAAVRAQNVDWRAQRKQLKSQQKLERNALKVQQQNMQAVLEEPSGFPALSALRQTHQMQRERRDLKQKQKDAMQDLKDRQRALKEMQRAYGQ